MECVYKVLFIQFNNVNMNEDSCLLNFDIFKVNTLETWQSDN